VSLADALALFRALAERRVEYAVVGAVAMAAHGVVRATQDVDLFVRATEENVARLRAALDDVFHDPDLEQLRADDLAGDYPVIKYVPPGAGYSIDILARLGGEYAYADIEVEIVEIEGALVRVATPRMLVRMKRGTVREQDHADAAALRRRFGIEDL
jgi:hypothetical protein